MMQFLSFLTPAFIQFFSFFCAKCNLRPNFLTWNIFSFLLRLCLLHPWKGFSIPIFFLLPCKWPSQKGIPLFNCTSRDILRSSENEIWQKIDSVENWKKPAKKKRVDRMSGLIRDFPSHFSACSCSNTFRVFPLFTRPILLPAICDGWCNKQRNRKKDFENKN